MRSTREPEDRDFAGAPSSETEIEFLTAARVVESTLERALRMIDEGITTPVGERFFRTLVRRTAETLGVRCVFVAESVETGSRERLVACWVDGEFVEGDLELDQPPYEPDLRGEVTQRPCSPGDDTLSRAPSWFGADLRSVLVLRLFDSGGEPIGHFGWLDDGGADQITGEVTVLKVLGVRCAAELERLRTQEALRASEARFRHLVEGSRDVIWRARLKPEFAVEYMSPSVERYLGVPASEFVRDPELMSKLVPEGESTGMLEDDGAFTPRRFRRFYRPDGTILWAEAHRTPVYDEQGELIALEGVTRDVTELIEARDTLRIRESQMRALIGALPDTVVRIDSKGTIVDVHAGEAGEAISLTEAGVGVAILDALPPHLATKLKPHLLSVLEGRKALTVVLEPGEAEMSRWEVRAIPLEQDAIVIFRDVSTAGWVPIEPVRQHAKSRIEGLVERQMLKPNAFGLTFRELTVLNMVAAGATDKAIAMTLAISIFTVNKHVSNILSKLGVASRTEAAIRAVQEQIIPA